MQPFLITLFILADLSHVGLITISCHATIRNSVCRWTRERDGEWPKSQNRLGKTILSQGDDTDSVLLMSIHPECRYTGSDISETPSTFLL
jgi:hypothetical protein